MVSSKGRESPASKMYNIEALHKIIKGLPGQLDNLAANPPKQSDGSDYPPEWLAQINNEERRAAIIYHVDGLISQLLDSGPNEIASQMVVFSTLLAVLSQSCEPIARASMIGVLAQVLRQNQALMTLNIISDILGKPFDQS